MTDGYKVAGGDRIGKTIIFAKNQAHAEFIEQRFNVAVPRVRRRVRPCDHAPARRTPRASSTTSRPTGQGAAHRDQRRHARHRHRRARGRQPGLLQDGPVEVQVLADDRPRHPPAPGPVRTRARTRRTSSSSTSAATSSTSARTCPARRGQLQKSLTQRLFEARLGLVIALDARRRGAGAAGVDGELAARVRRRDEPRQLPRPRPPSAGRDLGRPRALGFGVEGRRRGDPRAPGRPAVRRTGSGRGRQAVRPARAAPPARPARRRRGRRRTSTRDRPGHRGRAACRRRTFHRSPNSSSLLDEVAGDEWWVDVTLPMLEVMRLRLRGLVRFVEKTRLFVVVALLGGLSPLQPPVDLVGGRVPPLEHPVLKTW